LCGGGRGVSNELADHAAKVRVDYLLDWVCPHRAIVSEAIASSSNRRAPQTTTTEHVSSLLTCGRCSRGSWHISGSAPALHKVVGAANTNSVINFFCEVSVNPSGSLFSSKNVNVRLLCFMYLKASTIPG